jgi:predicted enzyme related to lactoylglutathione lyase
VKITAAAISLNVDDVAASADFVTTHLGFAEEMSAEGFVSLTRPDVGFNLIFLKTGLSTFKPRRIAGSAGEGLLIAFVVEDIDAEYARIQDEGITIVTPIETEEWGERYFQVADPNGVIFQLVQWVDSPGGGG